MGTFTKGAVVLIKFPFSDLTKIKLRPALVLAKTNYNDFILCQITSKKYNDANSTKIVDLDFENGSLHKDSFVRYTKIFTANNSIIVTELGKLQKKKFIGIINSLIEFLKNN